MQFQQNQKVNITGGTVTVGSITGTVNVAGTVAISGGSVSISGTPNVNVTGGSISISSGSVTISAGTITSITNAVTVANDIVVIIPTFFAAVLPINNNASSAPSQTVSAMKLLLACTSGTALTVRVSNNTTLDSYTCAVQTTSSNSFSLTIPVAADINDGITVSITKISGPGTTCNYQLLGLSQSPDIATPAGQPISNFPVGGLLKAHVTIAAGANTQIIAAPPAGLVYRIHSWSCKWSGASSNAFLNGVTSGFFYSVLGIAPAAGLQDYMQGLIITEALQVLNGSGTVAMDAFIFYDLISPPIIQ